MKAEDEAYAAAISGYKATRKTEMRAGDILENFYRIEALWELLREHAFTVGKEAIRLKRELLA
jgi:hypothetical protein